MSYVDFFLRLVLALGMVWFILFFLTLIHEYGHVAASDALKLKAEKVVIGWPVVFHVTIGGLPHGFGLLPVVGYLKVRGMDKLPLVKCAFLAAAGPITSVLLGAVLLFFDWAYPSWLVGIAGHASLTLAALNIVPLPPFDGWPVCKYVLSRFGINVQDSTQQVLTFFGIAAVGLSILIIRNFGGL